MLALVALWTSLSAQAPPPVYLNHVSLSVPANAFQTISTNSFLNDTFAGTGTRSITSSPGNETRTSLFLYGQKTYLDFTAFTDPSKEESLVIAFDVADRSQLPVLQSILKHKLKRKAEITTHTRRFGDHDIPWYDEIQLPVRGTGVIISIVAYYPEYLKVMNPALSTAGAEVSRQDYLALDYKENRLLNNIKRIAIWSKPNAIDDFMDIFGVFGYDLREGDSSRIARGPEIRLDFIPLTDGHSVEKVQLEFGLNRAYEGVVREDFHEGGEFLSLSNLAHWSFSAGK